MKRYLVYQAYGTLAIYHELIFSVYSLLNLYSGRLPFQLVVYTDNQDFLADKLPAGISYCSLSQATIQQWSGARQFVHRVKIMMLLDVTDRWPGLVLYADTDTFFTQPIDYLYESIEQGNYVMHLNEGPISARGSILFRKLHAFLIARREFGIPPDAVMYNAGILGFAPADRTALTTVLNLTDQLYDAYPKHIMEQLAFSYCFAGAGPVLEAYPVVYHYWNFKEFRVVLHEFFTANAGLPYETVRQQIHRIDPVRLHGPKLAYERLPFWQKAFRKLHKQRWQLPTYSVR